MRARQPRIASAYLSPALGQVVRGPGVVRRRLRRAGGAPAQASPGRATANSHAQFAPAGSHAQPAPGGSHAQPAPGGSHARPPPVADLQPAIVPLPIFAPEASTTPLRSAGFYQLTPRLPVGRREMANLWKHLRLLRREGPPVELDAEATIDAIGRTGVFRHRCCAPPAATSCGFFFGSITTALWLPFTHSLRLWSRASIGVGCSGRPRGFTSMTSLANTSRLTPPWSTGDPGDILADHAKGQSALIVSDAGAARGWYSKDRASATRDFLKDLASFTHRVAWLNPLPEDALECLRPRRSRSTCTCSRSTAGASSKRLRLSAVARSPPGEGVPMPDIEDLLAPESPVRQPWLPENLAQDEILAFEARFGSAHTRLACHAAFPLFLTPDLVNLIRINFLEDQVPWVAEADLLLSSLCRQLDGGLFVVDPGIREVLLADLLNWYGPDDGINHLHRLADFLLAYLERYTTPASRPDVLRASAGLARESSIQLESSKI